MTMATEKKIECTILNDEEVAIEWELPDQIKRIVHKLLLLDKDSRKLIISDYLTQHL